MLPIMILELPFLTFDVSHKDIAHASRSQTLAERNNSQIEIETLAIFFVFKKFKNMLYVRHFSLVTDHKALFTIFVSKIASHCIFKQFEKMGKYFAR